MEGIKNNETLLFSTVFGSHMYGLNTPSSDIDYKSVVCPDLNTILLQGGIYARNTSTGGDDSKNTSEDVDNTIISLHKFVKMACEGQMEAIDMLHSPKECVMSESPIFKELRDNRNLFYTKNMSAFLGYVKKQAAKYSIRGSRLNSMEKVLDSIK